MSNNIEPLVTAVMDCAFKVHRALGPGLFESGYQGCLEYELRQHGIRVACAVPLPVRYEGVRIDLGFQIDMLIDGVIIVENKAVEALHPVHHTQLLTYLRLTNIKLGLLINWNVPLLKQGFKRIVNNL